MSVTASGPALQERSPSRWQWKSFAIRFGLTTLALVIWFWTQSLIGGRGGSNLAISDGMHQLTAPLNHYLQLHATTANALLILSSAIIDLLGPAGANQCGGDAALAHHPGQSHLRQ